MLKEYTTDGAAVPESEPNPQLNIYALAALREFSLVQDFKTVRTIIIQPRLDHVSERVQTVAPLEAFGQDVWNCAVETSKPDAPLVPGEKQCRWCRAKATCPALTKQAIDQFEDVSEPEAASEDRLAEAMSKAALIEGWIKAVRAEVERRLLHAIPVPGYKLVQGKKGNRAWSDPAAAEALLKSMRLKVEEMYDLKLVSPTTAEKLTTSSVIGPRQWLKIKALISQTDGKPSVAPVSDKRPALDTSAGVDSFDDVSAADLL